MRPSVVRIAAIFAALAVSSPLFAADSMAVGSGQSRVVGKTMQLDRLTIADGGQLVAPEGFDLTLTVDGVDVPIAPGKYEGKIVITPTRAFLVNFSGYDPYHFRAALTVRDGKVVADQSVTAAAGDARIDDEIASGITIVSKEEKFNGIVVTGDSTYTIDDVDIDMTGNGGNDFAGWGAALMSSGNAHVTVNGAKIRTRGAVRTAIFIGGKSTMYVNDADIEVFSGTLPADYEFSIAPGRMMEVPYGLGLEGNVRATNLIDEATVYYNNCHVKSHGWGALSSDGNGPTRMFVNNCVIETEGSGYGAYANGDSHDYFSKSTFHVADVGVIVGGPGWVTFTDGTIVDSNKLGVMMHQGSGGSVLTVEKKSRINSKNTAVQIKGRGGDVIVDDAVLNPANGILVQTMPNDDPIMKAMMGGGPPGGGPGGGPPGAGPGGPPGGGPGGPPGGGGGPPGGGPGGAPPDMPGAGAMGFSPDVNVTFRNTTLAGDVVHAMSGQADMTVTLQNATLTGGVSTAVARPASGEAPTRETFRSVGEVSNTFQPGAPAHALKVYLDWNSGWTVDKTCYLNGLVIADGAVVSAAGGKTLRMTVDGASVSIAPGSYSGTIVLEVR